MVAEVCVALFPRTAQGETSVSETLLHTDEEENHSQTKSDIYSSKLRPAFRRRTQMNDTKRQREARKSLNVIYLLMRNVSCT